MRLPRLISGGLGLRLLNRRSGGDTRSFVRRHPGLVLYLLITLLVTSLYLNGASMFENLEVKIQDLLFRVREASQPSGNVVLLAIDDRSIDFIGRWPWGHQRHAQLVEALTYYNPKVVVMDHPLEENVEDYVSGTSQLLAENILQAENIVLPFFPILGTRTPRTNTAPDWLENSSLSSILPFEGESVPLASRLDMPGDQFGPSGRLTAAVLTHFDSDNTLRRQPMLVKFEKHFYPSVELAASAFAMGVSLDQIRFDQERGSLNIGDREVPVDEKGNYLINYYGPPGGFVTYSVRDFWEGEIDVESLQGKVVIVALTATGLTDRLSTPLGDEFTPAEKSAAVIDNILTGRFIAPLKASSNTELLVILAIGLFCAAILPRVSLGHRFVILFIFAVVIVNFNFILFTSFETLANTFYPTLEVFLFALAAPLLTQKKPGPREAASETSRRIKAESVGDQDVVRRPVDRTEYPAEMDETILIETSKTERDVFRQVSQAIKASSTPVPRGKPEGKDDTAHRDIEPDPVRSSLGRYEVIEEVGKGAMGTVYKGKDPAIGRMVALKTIRVDKIADASEVDELRERLIREANAAGNLSHPNIVTIYDVGEEGNLQYVAMEFLEGCTLEQIIGRRLQLNFRIAAKIVYQVCLALSYAHKNNIVHRDIKPANIMVMDDFRVKVMDFGIAHFESSNLTQTGIAMGTPNYISPEQLQGEPVTLSSDIFSLGVVFYEVLTGCKPFVADNISNLIFKIINESPSPPSSYDDKIPPMLDVVVRKALEKNPYDRYQSADEMARALEDFVSSFAARKAQF